MADNKEIKASTEAKRQKKADRRDAKAARKEANKVEEKKSRPNNIILAIMIFGVLIIMFAFAGGYNYFSKPANVEKYVTDNAIDQMYKKTPITEHSTMTLKAEKNTLKIWVNIDEDAPEDEVKQYQGEDGTDTLKNMGSYFLTSIKPQTRALSANVKVKVKQGDETINYVEMSYKEAKKYIEDAQKEAEESADKDADEADSDADAGTDTEADADAGQTEGE
jgi:acyl-CoA thioesterase